jgi:hypothetical protein
MELRRIPILFVPLALLGCISTPTARLGLISNLHIDETHKIPYAVGTHYGFRVDYHDAGKPLTLREEFRSPAPAHWRSSSHSRREMSIKNNGRTMTCEIQLGSHTAAPPEIHSFYLEDIQIVRGDPRGEYTLKLWLDDKPFKEFHFTLQ